MTDINLLPWRVALKIRQAKYFMIGMVLFIVMMVGLFVGLTYQSHHRLALEMSRHQQMEQSITQKMADYRRQLRARRAHQSVSKKHLASDEPQDDFRENPSEIIQVNYANAMDLVALLKDPSASLLSAHGLLMADPRTNVIWVQDTPEQIQHIKSVLQHFDVPSRQVLIEARLVNMSQESAKDLGVRFGLLQSGQDAQSNANDSVSKPGQGHERLAIDLAAIPLEASAASIGMAVAMLSRNALLDMELSALETEGRAEIIASPKLMATNQEPAVIESGEDIPYQEVTPSGATSVSFKKAVLSLKVLPQITTEGKLMMHLSINQNSDSGRRVQGVPIILTKSIETRVLVKDGQTVVLGGIYKQDRNRHLTRVPFLGSLPVLGQLFQRKQWHTRHDELLIFITPKIMMATK